MELTSGNYINIIQVWTGFEHILLQIGRGKGDLPGRYRVENEGKDIQKDNSKFTHLENVGSRREVLFSPRIVL
jgi:hypothetical protein